MIREHQALSVINGCRGKDVAVYIATGLAFLLGIIIVYNMVVLSVEEKKTDYATLIALGSSVKGFLGLAVTESAIRYLTALFPGVAAGCLISAFVLDRMSSMKTRYPFVHIGTVCLTAALLSFVYLLAGGLFTLRKVKRVEPAAALNARE